MLQDVASKINSEQTPKACNRYVVSSFQQCLNNSNPNATKIIPNAQTLTSETEAHARSVQFQEYVLSMQVLATNRKIYNESVVKTSLEHREVQRG